MGTFYALQLYGIVSVNKKNAVAKPKLCRHFKVWVKRTKKLCMICHGLVIPSQKRCKEKETLSFV
jgi:hypothetical protein